MKKLIKLSSINPRKILNIYIGKIKKILWALGRDAFLLILIFVLMDIFFGEILFYRYIFIVNATKPKIVATPVKFKEDLYKSVMEKWDIREDVFNDSSEEIHLDPFLSN